MWQKRNFYNNESLGLDSATVVYILAESLQGISIFEGGFQGDLEIQRRL